MSELAVAEVGQEQLTAAEILERFVRLEVPKKITQQDFTSLLDEHVTGNLVELIERYGITKPQPPNGWARGHGFPVVENHQPGTGFEAGLEPKKRGLSCLRVEKRHWSNAGLFNHSYNLVIPVTPTGLVSRADGHDGHTIFATDYSPGQDGRYIQASVSN